MDGDNLITIIDLFLVITIWFAFSFSMLLCYFVFDTFDRMRRNRDIELGNETEVFDAQDEFEKLNEEDSKTDESMVSDLQGVVIECRGECAHFSTNKDLA